MTGRARANGEGSIFVYKSGFAAYSWVQTPDGLRKKKWVYGKTREIVHDKWIKLQQAAMQGPIATRSPRLEEFLKSWLADVVRPNLAPTTYVNYELFVRLHIAPVLGQKRLDRLTVRDVQTWLNALALKCQCCEQGKDAARDDKRRRCCALGQCCDKKLSQRTIGDIRAALRAALNRAIQEELISKNPAMAVTLPRRRRKSRNARKKQAWTTEEARLFLESARADGESLYAAYVLILVLGLRKGEVLGLRWDDVDLEEAELAVNLQLQRVSKQLLHRETKTEGSEDLLPLPDICTAALKLRKERQDQERVTAGPAWQGDKLAFTTRWGTPVEPRNFNRSWDTRCRKAGVRRITVHDGRRSCGTLLADLDVHPRVAMRILRHAQFSLTMEIYTLASTKATRDALKRLGESLDEQP